MKQHRLKARLALNKNERTPYITFDMPIDPLADRSHCDLIGSQLHEFGCVWERCDATATLQAQLPDTAGLYMFVWLPSIYLEFDGGRSSKLRRQRFPMVLYIGQVGADFGSENTIRQRYVNEYAKLVDADVDHLWADHKLLDRRARLAKYLAVDPLQFWFTTLSDRTRIRLLERRLIEMFNPPACKQLRARLRPERQTSLADQEAATRGQ